MATADLSTLCVQMEVADSTNQLGQEQLPSGQQVSRRQRCINIVHQEKEVKKNLLLQYRCVECMVYSRIFPAWTLLSLRVVMACICTAVFLGGVIHSPYFWVSDPFNARSIPKRHHVMCFMSLWSYVVVNIYFIATVVNTIFLLIGARFGRNSFSLKARDIPGGYRATPDSAVEHVTLTVGCLAKFGLRFQWLLYNIACNTGLLVTIVYYAFIYGYTSSNIPFIYSMVDALLHGFNTVFMFIDTACSGVQVSLVQAVHTMLFGLVYILFTFFYWVPDHSNVLYVIILDWNNAGRTVGIMCLLMFVVVPIFQLVWWLVYLARCFAVDALVKLCTHCSTSITNA